MAGRARTPSRSDSSSSAPRRPGSIARSRRPARRRSIGASSMSMPVGAGGSSASSAVAMCPETLVGALIALERAWDAVRDDPRFWAELRELRTRYVGGPSALYRADRLAAALERAAGRPRPPPPLPQARGPQPHGRPQDHQRARPGAAHPAAGQDPRHRRDRRRPARRGHRHRLRPARPALRRLHGCRGRPPPGAQRPAHARPRRRGARGDERIGDAQGRHQRGHARLGHQRRVRPTTSWARPSGRTPTRGWCATSSASSATTPPPSSAGSRAGCRTWPWPASAAAPTPSAC